MSIVHIIFNKSYKTSPWTIIPCLSIGFTGTVTGSAHRCMLGNRRSRDAAGDTTGLFLCSFCAVSFGGKPVTFPSLHPLGAAMPDAWSQDARIQGLFWGYDLCSRSAGGCLQPPDSWLHKEARQEEGGHGTSYPTIL